LACDGLIAVHYSPPEITNHSVAEMFTCLVPGCVHLKQSNFVKYLRDINNYGHRHKKINMVVHQMIAKWKDNFI
jgi:hypothetical protein